MHDCLPSIARRGCGTAVNCSATYRPAELALPDTTLKNRARNTGPVKLAF